MNALESVEVICPYCGEDIEILVDCTAGDQNYFEDCQICCRPIKIDVSIDEEGKPHVRASQEEEL
jgi:hypothetical protein